jgi:hypothetical protein
VMTFLMASVTASVQATGQPMAYACAPVGAVGVKTTGMVS